MSTTTKQPSVSIEVIINQLRTNGTWTAPAPLPANQARSHIDTSNVWAGPVTPTSTQAQALAELGVAGAKVAPLHGGHVYEFVEKVGDQLFTFALFVGGNKRRLFLVDPDVSKTLPSLSHAFHTWEGGELCVNITKLSDVRALAIAWAAAYAKYQAIPAGVDGAKPASAYAGFRFFDSQHRLAT
jgi:hypothetical protein